jgi:glycosyltransferase involved in cell wall biosynthesis
VRRADAAAAAEVTTFVAISRHVADRIARAYGRDSIVVYPPVDTGLFTPGAPDPAFAPDGQRPYLLLGESAPYKRFAAGVMACRALDRPLIVAGGGYGQRELLRLAGPRTRFVRDPADATVRALYRSCRALLYPGEEDFGLVPLEAMACGRPVVALGRGGALETVRNGLTGVLYAPARASGLPAEAAALAEGMRYFESIEDTLAQEAAVARAGEFSLERFREALGAVVERAIGRTSGRAPGRAAERAAVAATGGDAPPRQPSDTSRPAPRA